MGEKGREEACYDDMIYLDFFSFLLAYYIRLRNVDLLDL